MVVAPHRRAWGTLWKSDSAAAASKSVHGSSTWRSDGNTHKARNEKQRQRQRQRAREKTKKKIRILLRDLLLLFVNLPIVVAVVISVVVSVKLDELHK